MPAPHLGPLLLIPLVFFVLLVSLIAGVGAQSPSQADCSSPNSTDTGAGAEKVADIDLSSDQMGVAKQIVSAVRGFAPTSNKPQAAVIALATAMQESTLGNPHYGDRDSLGAFQQRPSQGWGTPEQVRNVPFATRTFLEHLVQLPGWESMRVTDAAAEVQRPQEDLRGEYQQWVPLATALTEKLWGTALPTGSTQAVPASAATGNASPYGLFMAQDCTTASAGGSVPPNCTARGGAAETGLRPDAIRVMRCALTVFGPHTVGGLGERPNPSDHTTGRAVDIMIDGWDTPSGEAEGWKIANWARNNAKQLGVTYVIWAAKIWSVERDDEGWRTYSHPTGSSNPTLDHLDHVHVSVQGNAGSDTPLPGTPGTPAGTQSGGRHLVASFNALGHHHSEPGGKDAALDSGPTRMSRTLDKLEGHGISLVGLQEFETPQAQTVRRRGWRLHRATPNNRLRGGNTMGNAIAWNPDTWTSLATGELRVRYRSRTLHMPIVRLQDAAGSTLTILSIHNPSRRSEAPWRARARQAENKAIKRLPGPLIITGDFNERAPSLCAATSAASGGAGCHPKRWGGIDFIFTSGGASTTSWQVDNSTRGSETDVHPLVFAALR